MCGIVAAVAKRNVSAILLEGLKRLEYRGYDSAGMALLSPDSHELIVRKVVGKVAVLEAEVDQDRGNSGIAHTRWATHGKPNADNAHPHCTDKVAIVHNGIIENYQSLRADLTSRGYVFQSQTDSEVIAKLLDHRLQSEPNLTTALQGVVKQLRGAFAIAALQNHKPDIIAVAKKDSPLVLGVGMEENYVASDTLALRQVTDRFVYLEENETAEITLGGFTIYDADNQPVERTVEQVTDQVESMDKGEFRHFMLKEIFEQPKAIKDTLRGRISGDKVLEQAFGTEAGAVFDQVQALQIVACGTSYHAGIVAKYWLEDWAGIPCNVEVASEYRYRKTTTLPNTLFVTISQSGQTADTLAALDKSKQQGYLASLAICNVANSELVRNSDLVFLTEAGIEIGVASTKAFTTQLIALQILAIALARRTQITPQQEQQLVTALHDLPVFAAAALQLNSDIQTISHHFTERHHSLFLGRGVQYPIAMEGALKIKEISYIHAEAYPSGELKHGPLALVDSDMPVIAVAPSGDLLGKIKSNLEEVAARGGKLYVFADENAGFLNDEQTTVINVPHCQESIAPIIYTLPLQLLSYHVAVNKGTDVDQPRNLAKSVTVE